MRLLLLLAAGPQVVVGGARASVCQRGGSGEIFAVSADCPPGAAPWRGAGCNIFDSFWTMSSAMGVPDPAPTAAALRTAAAAGIKVFRVFASPWGPKKAFWAEHPRQYWVELDAYWDAVDRSGLVAVASIGTDDWDRVANAVTPGLNESFNDCVLNESPETNSSPKPACVLNAVSCFPLGWRPPREAWRPEPLPEAARLRLPPARREQTPAGLLTRGVYGQFAQVNQYPVL
mmetsp:Transcript_45800/g.143316  ORF Transcript_45800/g.143316 Transcript_45800/m.143316 type:complete len:231 (+) Transcript_45800:169-861(+)